MPRQKKDNANSEPKRRSRGGCWPCKTRKVKCDEGKPQCQNCVKLGDQCDYSIRLNWGGRSKRGQDEASVTQSGTISTLTARDTTSTHEQARPQVQPPQALHNVVQGQPFQQHDQITTGPEAYRLPSFAQFQSQSTPLTVQDDEIKWYSENHHLSRPGHDFSSYEPRPDTRYTQLLPTPQYSYLRSSPQGTKRRKLDLISGGDVSEESSLFAKPNRPENASSHSCRQASSSSSLHPSGTHAINDYGPGQSFAVESTRESRTNTYSNSSAGTEPVEYRRLSVSSLLSGPPGQESGLGITSRYRQSTNDGHMFYGYDFGYPDLDVPRNDDRNAVVLQNSGGSRPQIHTLRALLYQGSTAPTTSELPPAYEHGNYYATPVAIRIPMELEPLPDYLTDNPMNLIYFHHFINHTARILVPLDCEANPLRTVLARMACGDVNLMNLLLTYSAAHRAGLLDQPEPANRIALWVRDVFPDLRTALSSPGPIPDSTLATAVMLASLDITSPDSFDVPITWQTHLSIARQIIISRGGIDALSRDPDIYVAFVCKWYTYMEIFGSLSGGIKSELLLGGDSEIAYHDKNPADHQIDCVIGCTARCMGLLARIARLGSECDAQRLDEQGNVRSTWHGPTPKIESEALRLSTALEESRRHPQEGCRHTDTSNTQLPDPGPSLDSNIPPHRNDNELFAASKMFHLAGQIHLHRRLLGKPVSDASVQTAVSGIVAALSKVRKGSPAEGAILFPLFTAGCDALDEKERGLVMERFKGVEGWGMTNALKARRLMQEVWNTGKPWETLVAGEFFG